MTDRVAANPGNDRRTDLAVPRATGAALALRTWAASGCILVAVGVASWLARPGMGAPAPPSERSDEATANRETRRMSEGPCIARGSWGARLC